MLVRWPEHWLGDAEYDVACALEAVPDGLALLGVVLPSRGGREIDALLLRPSGIVTVEVKGTGMTGQVQTEPNGPWLVGGQRADFFGGASPVRQARTQAQRLRTFCTDSGLRVPYISALVVIVGEVDHAAGKVMDGVWATDLDRLPAALDLLRGRPLLRADARRLLDLLGLGLNRPTEADLDEARFPRDDGTLPPPPATPTVTARPPRPAATGRKPTQAAGYGAAVTPMPPPAYPAPQPPPRRAPARPQRPRQRGRGPQQPQWYQWGQPNPYAPPGPYVWPYARPKKIRPWLRVFVTFGGLVLAMTLLTALLAQYAPPAPTPTPAPPRRPPATRSPAPR